MTCSRGTPPCPREIGDRRGGACKTGGKKARLVREDWRIVNLGGTCSVTPSDRSPAGLQGYISPRDTFPARGHGSFQVFVPRGVQRATHFKLPSGGGGPAAPS